MRRPIFAAFVLAQLVVLIFVARGAPAARAVTMCLGLPVTIEGTTAGEVINGTPGDDVINGLAGNDVINGLGGNDTLCGDAGDDTIHGGDGDDVVVSGDGDDVVNGGADGDTLDYTTSGGPQGVVVDLCAHIVTGGASDAVTHFERVKGTLFNDTILGCAGDEYLYGDDGDDTLDSGGGIDTIDGGAGTDDCGFGTHATFVNCDVVHTTCVHFGERDCDNVPDAIDNCPATSNVDQTNTDAEPLTSIGAPNDLSLANADELGDACNPDDDNDGLADTTEPFGCFGSGPLDATNADTDGDRIIDTAECLLGSDPTNPASKPGPPAIRTDTDGDGLSDEVEASFIDSDPNAIDSDGDGILDGVEYKGYGTSLTGDDTDSDGCPDGQEVASVDGDSVVDSLDLAIVAIRLRQSDKPVQDVNKDGTINSLDLQLVARNFNPATCP